MTETATGTRLQVSGLCKRYQSGTEELVVLDDVSFDLEAGHVLVVVGPSGAGKSTLLNIIGSLDRPDAGSVRLGDVQVQDLSGDRLSAFRSGSVGFVFQDHHLLPQCTALENVILPTLASGGDGAADRAQALLERVGLGDRVAHMPGRLSGGERQRVAVARALVNDPPLLLCDEPTGNLDRETGSRIADLFAELAEKDGRMLIVVTHDLELADRFERRAELRDGKLSER